MVKISAFLDSGCRLSIPLLPEDTFNGALITALLEEKRTRGDSFCRAAAGAVTRKGAQPSVPWREETDAFFRQAER